MINESELTRLSFDLDQARPIHLMINTHEDLAEHWFDMHYQFEIGVIISGRMKRIYFDYQQESGPGDVWFCGMWEPHGFELIETPCEVVVFVIDPKYIAQSQVLSRDILKPFQVGPEHRPVTAYGKSDQVVSLARKTQTVLEQGDDPDWAKLMLFQLLLLLLENWQAPEDSGKDFALQQSIQGALQLVFREKRLISTEEAAAACHMSVTKFRSVFKKLMNHSFSDFALEYRVLGAKAQLKNSGDTQEAVAHNWGFTDASHLHKYIRNYE